MADTDNAIPAHVIPAKAGIQWLAREPAALDPGLRRGDVQRGGLANCDGGY
jgi:hypothetical protein